MEFHNKLKDEQNSTKLDKFHVCYVVVTNITVLNLMLSIKNRLLIHVDT